MEYSNQEIVDNGNDDSSKHDDDDDHPPDKSEVLQLTLDDVEIDFYNPLGRGAFCMVYPAQLKSEQTTTTTTTTTTDQDSNVDNNDNDNDTTKPTTTTPTKTYALKQLKTGVRNANLARKHLNQEARLLSLFAYPNIISLRGYCENTFILTELLADTLERHVKEWQSNMHDKEREWSSLLGMGGPSSHYVPADEVLRRLHQYVMGIVCAMHVLHSNDIVFRDLKPDNVGIDHRGDIKLFDFGLAVQLHPPDYRCSESAGTIRYAAPEVVGRYLFGPPADVYSFAIMVWQIVTSRLPFEKELGVDDPYKLTVETKALPNDKRPSLKYVESAALRSLLEDMWQLYPKKRPQFDDIFRSLCEILGKYTPPPEKVGDATASPKEKKGPFAHWI